MTSHLSFDRLSIFGVRLGEGVGRGSKNCCLRLFGWENRDIRKAGREYPARKSHFVHLVYEEKDNLVCTSPILRQSPVLMTIAIIPYVWCHHLVKNLEKSFSDLFFGAAVLMHHTLRVYSPWCSSTTTNAFLSLFFLFSTIFSYTILSTPSHQFSKHPGL